MLIFKTFFRLTNEKSSLLGKGQSKSYDSLPAPCIHGNTYRICCTEIYPPLPTDEQPVFSEGKPIFLFIQGSPEHPCNLSLLCQTLTDMFNAIVLPIFHYGY